MITPRRMIFAQIPLVLLVLVSFGSGIYFRHHDPFWNNMKEARPGYDLLGLIVMTASLAGFIGMAAKKYWGLVVTAYSNLLVFFFLTVFSPFCILVLDRLMFKGESDPDIQLLLKPERLILSIVGIYALILAVPMLRKNAKIVFSEPNL